MLTMMILRSIHTSVAMSKHGGTREVSVATISGFGSNSKSVDCVWRQTANLGLREKPDLDTLPVGDVGRRQRVVEDAVPDHVVVQRRIPGHFDHRRRDSSKLNVCRRRQNIFRHRQRAFFSRTKLLDYFATGNHSSYSAYAERCIYCDRFRPSVCPSQSGIMSKLLQLRSCGHYWRIAP